MQIFSLSTAKDGQLIYGGGAPGELGIFPKGGAATAKVTESARSPFNGSVWATAAAHKSNLIACGTTTGYVSIFDSHN
jgi:hypothetical protein